MFSGLSQCLAVWEETSHWSSQKQRENCSSPYSFIAPSVSPHLQYTLSSRCPIISLCFLLATSPFHCPWLPRWLHELSNAALHLSLLLLPPLTRWIQSVLLSPSLLSCSFPPSLPHDLCLSHPPTVQPSLSSFVFSLFSACFVCVYVTVFFLWLTREMLACCWALEEAVWQNYSSIWNQRLHTHRGRYKLFIQAFGYNELCRILGTSKFQMCSAVFASSCCLIVKRKMLIIEL